MWIKERQKFNSLPGRWGVGQIEQSATWTRGLRREHQIEDAFGEPSGAVIGPQHIPNSFRDVAALGVGHWSPSLRWMNPCVHSHKEGETTGICTGREEDVTEKSSLFWWVRYRCQFEAGCNWFTYFFYFEAWFLWNFLNSERFQIQSAKFIL